jgi:hypothetical protein
VAWFRDDPALGVWVEGTAGRTAMAASGKTPVLLLSDLGLIDVPHRIPRPDPTTFAALARALEEGGTHLSALVPVGSESLARNHPTYAAVSWDDPSIAEVRRARQRHGRL